MPMRAVWDIFALDVARLLSDSGRDGGARVTQLHPDLKADEADPLAEIATALVTALVDEEVPDHIRELAVRLQAALDARAEAAADATD